MGGACGKYALSLYFLQASLPKLNALPFFSRVHATCLANLIFFITQIISDEQHNSESSHFAVFSNLQLFLHPQPQTISLSTLFANTLSLCPSLNVRGQRPKSHNWYNNIVQYFNPYVFQWEMRAQKFLHRILAGIPPIYCSFVMPYILIYQCHF